MQTLSPKHVKVKTNTSNSISIYVTLGKKSLKVIKYIKKKKETKKKMHWHTDKPDIWFGLRESQPTLF